MHVFLVSQQYWLVVGRSRRTPRRAFSAHLDHRVWCEEGSIYIKILDLSTVKFYKEKGVGSDTWRIQQHWSVLVVNA